MSATPRRTLLAVLAVAVLVVATGCGSASGPSSGASNGAFTSASTNCAKHASPVSATGLAAALRQHGFDDVTVSRDCSMMATPLLYAEVASGSLLTCGVYGPATSWGHAMRTRGPAEESSAIWHGIKAYAFYENVECQLYPDEGRASTEMAQLTASLRDLRKP